jgi:serine phosphatase RsbU (regulator of sigma subunit)
MLGMNEAARFGEVEFQLDAHELLVLTSDGMVESPCADGKRFGTGGIARFFEDYRGDSPLADLLADVRRHSPSSRLEDDVSAVLVAPAGAPAG